MWTAWGYQERRLDEPAGKRDASNSGRLLKNGWAYTSGGAVGTITQGSSSSPAVTKVSALAAQGLRALVAGPVWGAVTDPDGHKTSEQLDASGRVTQRLDAEGGLWQFAYGNCPLRRNGGAGIA
jgi:YD repeat-containing protein